ncbi:DEAD/DEAH box helicase family protein [Candidatus Dependentiae bacterium]|nr:DEAD/DEAH box helicase family protein [Candidatus Dependentiae bacterium]
MFEEDYTEAQTRKELIDKALLKANWDVQNFSQVVPEFEIEGTGAGKYKIINGVKDSGDSGFSDYLLLDRKGDPLAVVEAKRTSRDPISGIQQAEDYADGIKKVHNVNPLIFLTNGYETWFWNRERYPPLMVHGFFERTELERIQFQNRNRKDLSLIPIKPEIIDRDYQIEACKRIFEGLEKNKRKFLLVMATGTGKTRTVTALIDVLLRAKWVKRVLFLVDRSVLANQAFIDGFKTHIPSESRSYIWSSEIDSSSRLYVSTIQTMMQRFHTVTPGFFDLIISDECHRSIYNKWRDVLSYFHAIQIGLTATPSDFVERDTFKFFDCEDKCPTFNYSYEKAVSEKVLVDFRPAYSAKTNFQIKGIKGNELPPSIQKKMIAEGYSLEEIDFEGTDFEKKVTNLGTNESLVREFMDVCIKDDSGVIPAKTIIFAISHAHAKRLWKIFNKLYPEYKGRLVEIIDSKMERPLRLIDKFKNENFPRIAISVDMLDTGVDIKEICNLVFAKPVFSKIKFWQMIGRGTRILEKKIENRKPWCLEKDQFLIIDHWNNFEYFGEKPEGERPAQLDPIPSKIFKTRLEKLKIFINKKHEDHINKIKGELINDIKHLPETSITIKENRKNIDKALSANTWEIFEEKSYEFLYDTIAPLTRFITEFNINQLKFLLKVERLGLVILIDNNKDIELLRNSIISDLKCLPMNLSSVKKKKEIILKVISDEFWLDLDYDKVEWIKDELTELMKHKMVLPRELIELDIDDEIIQRKWLEFGPEGEGDYVINYRKRIEDYILNIAEQNKTIQKIKKNQVITEEDLVNLENELNSPELYISEDNLKKVYSQPYATLVEFIKFIIGMYEFPKPEDLINDAFNTYVVERNNRNPLNSDQLLFLRTIKNVFAKKKKIEYNDLFDPPFTSMGIDAAIKIFSEGELREIIQIFNQLHINGKA